MANAYGVPIRHRMRQRCVRGLQTGDLVRATPTRGGYAGVHIGRVTIQQRPTFRVKGLMSLRTPARCCNGEMAMPLTWGSTPSPNP